MGVVEWFALVGLLVQLLGMGAGAFWVVGSVRNTSNQLAHSMELLNKTLDKLETTMKSVETKQIDHEIRMRLMEARNQE